MHLAASNVLMSSWLLGSALLLWLALPIKRVRLSDGALINSRYFRECRVPFALIESVSQSQ